jgi:glucosylceramidase
MEVWAEEMLSDPASAEFIYGLAVHWYSSTFKIYDDILRKIKEKFPGKSIIHTEGCIDDLGKDAPEGVTDPVRFKEVDWFNNDAFWWNDNATDWAYSVTWEGVNAADHPIYTPVHRYARDIIGCLNNGVSGWVDWNIVLDRNGGPNHVGNFCGAPIMIDLETAEVHYTPLFHVLKQFSRTIRPKDHVVQTDINHGESTSQLLHACATLNSEKILSVQILNPSKKPLDYTLQIGTRAAKVEITPNSLQTIRVQL